jgi:brefeldin A-inhibited guanine nucleotide-exchange protein
MRSKLLSLYLILNILNEHTEVFLTSKVIFISNNEHKLHKTREVSFLTAVKPYLCLCLSRNLASEIPKVFEMTLSVFEKVVVGLRHNMKVNTINNTLDM